MGRRSREASERRSPCPAPIGGLLLGAQPGNPSKGRLSLAEKEPLGRARRGRKGLHYVPSNQELPKVQERKMEEGKKEKKKTSSKWPLQAATSLEIVHSCLRFHPNPLLSPSSTDSDLQFRGFPEIAPIEMERIAPINCSLPQ